jgi:hypothetical protein
VPSKISPSDFSDIVALQAAQKYLESAAASNLVSFKNILQ